MVPMIEGLYTDDVHPRYIDKVLQKHYENIESFTWVTRDSHKMKNFNSL